MIRQSLEGCATVLDVGCGSDSPYKYIKQNSIVSTGVDIHEPSIEISRRGGIHNDYVITNVMDIDKHFVEGSFDAVIAFDLIEHLTKEDGILLLSKMQKIANKKVIITTPNGFVPQRPYPDNPYQEHLSGWDIDEMQLNGFKVSGFNGLKSIRGEYAGLLYRPKWFWAIVSIVSQLFVRSRPKYAFHILCVKDIS